MTSQSFLKLPALLTIFVSITGVAMESNVTSKQSTVAQSASYSAKIVSQSSPATKDRMADKSEDGQKRSVDALYAEIRNNLDRYSDIYKWDIIDLRKEIRANNFANIVSILEQMADKIPNYSQEDVRNFVSLIENYAEELYTNELIGLHPFGTLAKHQNILCHIQVVCNAKLNATNEVAAPDATAEPEIIQKSRSIKKSFENDPVEKKQNLTVVNDLAEKLQKKINVIAHARILGDLQQKNVSIDVAPKALNNPIKKWNTQLIKALKDAIIKKDATLINRLWHANFNDNHAHFKAREKDLYDDIVQRLKKDTTIKKEDISWFREHVSKLIHKKEVHFTLKSKTSTQPDKQENKSTDESKSSSFAEASDFAKASTDKSADRSSTSKPGDNKPTQPQMSAAHTIMITLNRLKNAVTYDAILETLQHVSELQITDTFTTSESVAIKNEIEEAKRRIYQNCMLGLYGNQEQKLQLNIFDMCAYELTVLRTQLSKHLKESDKEIENYTNQADKSRQQCLYEIKVIRSPEKIDTKNEKDGAAWKSRDRDMATWKTIVQDRLSAEVERQNAPAIQKIADANFEATKTPLLAENHADIIQNMKHMFNGDKANSDWMNNHANVFIPSQPQDGVMPNQPAGNNPPPSTSFYQTCKNHWVLSSLALGALMTCMYCLWEEWYAQDEDNVKPVAKEQAKDEKTAADKKPTQETDSSKKATANKKTKTNAAKQTKTA